MTTRSGLAASAIAGVVAVLLAPRVAHAQNQDPYFYGDDAALMAGSTVASGRDSGAIWYNPAGFGGVKRSSISGSATTFGFRVRQIPNALRVRLVGGERAIDLSGVDVLSVPNAVVVGGALSDRVTLAGGLLTTQRDVVSTMGVLDPYLTAHSDGRTKSVSQRIDLQGDQAKYHFGPALGIEVADGVRLGFAVFGTYSKTTASMQYALDLAPVEEGDTERTFATAAARVTGTYFGVAASAGLQWDLGPVSLGLTLRSPEVALAASMEGGSVTTAARTGGADAGQSLVQVESPPRQNAGGEIVVPGRALLGVAIPIAPSSWVEVGADAAHPISAGTVATARDAVVNARAGIRYALSPGWVVGGGLFTDLATERVLDEFLTSTRLDWYGLTAGFSKRTPFSLASNSSPEALVLVTTLSVRVGAGFGQARAETVDLTSELPRDDRSDVVFYEVMPYLGTSVVF